MSDNAEKAKQAVDLLDRMLARIGRRIPEREVSQFVMLFLVAMEEMENTRKAQP